jgi:transcriptional regulator with GAF, ATPase, and Fis domain
LIGSSFLFRFIFSSQDQIPTLSALPGPFIPNPKSLIMDDTQTLKKPLNVPPSDSANLESGDEPIASLRSVRAETEVKAIVAALKRTGWNRKQAARLLSISYRGLLYKIRRHNITAA